MYCGPRKRVRGHEAMAARAGGEERHGGGRGHLSTRRRAGLPHVVASGRPFASKAAPWTSWPGPGPRTPNDDATGRQMSSVQPTSRRSGRGPKSSEGKLSEKREYFRLLPLKLWEKREYGDLLQRAIVTRGLDKLWEKRATPKRRTPKRRFAGSDVSWE